MFSAETKQFCKTCADRAKLLYVWAEKEVGFAWELVAELLLGFIIEWCKPDDEAEQKELIATMALKCQMNGVKGCIEACCGKAKAKRVREKMKKRLKIKSATEQDQRFYTTVIAGHVEKEAAIKAMGNAVSNDEADGDE